MIIRGIALAGLLGVLVAATPAQEMAGVGWVGSWDEAKTEAAERNVPIFFTVQQDENPSCKQMESAFRDASFIRASRRVVCVVANPDVKHGVRTVMVKGHKTPFCQAYDTIQCDAHVACQSAIGNFQKSGSFDIPMQVWCRPNGEELFKITGPNGTGAQNAASMVKDMERALDRISGPKLGRSEWLALKQLLRDGDEAGAKMEHKIAMACYKKVKDTKDSEKFAAMGKSRYESYINQCKSLVGKALKQYEKSAEGSKERKEVKPILQKIAKEMKGNEAGDAAEEALKQVK
jgi:hypothetical protein